LSAQLNDSASSELRIPVAEVFVPLLAPSRYKGAHGGRGSGKSHFFAELWLDESIRDRLDFVCVREHQKSLQFSVKKLLESKIEGLNAGAYFQVQDKKITSHMGGLTIFEGMANHTADSIKSLEAFDRAYCEEGQKLSQRSLDLLRPTIRKSGSELWFSWNPDQPTDPVDALLLSEKPPPGTAIVTANYMDNPWFPTELRREMEYDRERDPEKYQHIWLGGYQRRSETRVFKNWKVEEFERPAGTIHRQGADWGYAIDPSVLVRASIDGNRLYVDYEAYMIGCEIVNLPDLFDRVPESRKWFVTADSARPETISYMQKHGYPRMNAAIKGPGSIEEGVNFLQSFEIVVHPRCVHTIDELTMYSYKTDPLTGKVLPVLQDKKNNVIDALRYACEGVRKAKRERPVVKRETVRQHVAHGWMGS
jgi:phage terminase large subunit